MTVNLPFGGTIEIINEHERYYVYNKKYRFKIVNSDGWDINKATYRDLIIDSILNQKSYDILYHMYLSGNFLDNFLDTANVFIDLKKSELRISGENISVKFKCNSLTQAEKLIDMILEPNGYVVAPVNLIK